MEHIHIRTAPFPNTSRQTETERSLAEMSAGVSCGEARFAHHFLRLSVWMSQMTRVVSSVIYIPGNVERCQQLYKPLPNSTHTHTRTHTHTLKLKYLGTVRDHYCC